MAVLTHSRVATSSRSRTPRRSVLRLPASPALSSLLQPLLVSGALMALVVPMLQLSLLGPVDNFASLWIENWLIAWAIAFPIAYLAAPVGARFARFLSAATRPSAAGIGLIDIAAVCSGGRGGFSVSRNLMVREDFYRA